MPLEKALITNLDTGDKIPVMFNPEEYTLNKDNNFAQQTIPGLRAPLLQFTHGNMRTLEMELFFDTYEEHRNGSQVLNRAGEDVRKLTGKVVGLLDINSQTHAPPVLLVTWSSLSFTCVLARVGQKFILFRDDGTPVRARLTVTFNEFTNAEREAKEVGRLTADFTKAHIVLLGEDLSSIAGKHYENPLAWRPIAIVNNLDDPRNIFPGLELQIPSLPFVDAATGEEVA
ncbi:MAG: LysM peptidoglycan-binding domain-containing protein [Acidobacteria bacterium]|nr:LysM peptidoglycan-binding domain-containing protein [Acidobacteriota bacterium]